MPRTIDIDPNGGRPSVVLTIGQANTGRFAIYLFEADQVTHRQIGSGTARVGAGQPISLGDPAALPNKILTWDTAVIPITGTRFSVTLTVLQDGRQVTSFTDAGDLKPGDNVGLIRAGATFI
jgi:hypothetical protein